MSMSKRVSISMSKKTGDTDDPKHEGHMTLAGGGGTCDKGRRKSKGRIKEVRDRENDDESKCVK